MPTEHIDLKKINLRFARSKERIQNQLFKHSDTKTLTDIELLYKIQYKLGIITIKDQPSTDEPNDQEIISEQFHSLLEEKSKSKPNHNISEDRKKTSFFRKILLSCFNFFVSDPEPTSVDIDLDTLLDNAVQKNFLPELLTILDTQELKETIKTRVKEQGLKYLKQHYKLTDDTELLTKLSTSEYYNELQIQKIKDYFPECFADKHEKLDDILSEVAGNRKEPEIKAIQPELKEKVLQLKNKPKVNPTPYFWSWCCGCDRLSPDK